MMPARPMARLMRALLVLLIVSRPIVPGCPPERGSVQVGSMSVRLWQSGRRPAPVAGAGGDGSRLGGLAQPAGLGGLLRLFPTLPGSCCLRPPFRHGLCPAVKRQRTAANIWVTPG